MIGTSVRPELGAHSLDARPFASRAIVFALVAGVTVLATLTAALIAIAAFVSTVSPSISFSVQDGAIDQPLNGDVRVDLTGWSVQLEGAALYETPIGPDGKAGQERPVGVQATLLSDTWMSEGSALSFRPTESAFSPDARYRLVVQSSAITAALPLPERASSEREVRFTTLRSPSPWPQVAPVKVKWGQPVVIQWDAPVEDVRYEVTPPTPIRTTIDPATNRASSVVFEDPAGGQTYQLAVVGARGANGVPFIRRAEYAVIAPARPVLLEADEPRTVELGQPLTLKWSVPVDKLSLAIEPEVTSSWQVDRQDPTLVRVKLDGLAQGASYNLKVTEATSKEGAPLAEVPSLTFQTPERLMVEAWDPDPELDGGRVAVTTKPTITFAQPIRDRRNATAALSMEPKTPGKWEWLDDQRVQFVPTKSLPYDAEVTITIKPGADGARSVSGSYFEKAAILAFMTEEDKLIDVDVTRQIMTLYEKGRSVRTFPVATGLPGADTPLGEFNVEYKMPTARFQGVNVTGARYDIPDVHWVLAFMGDYTIHGAYWRSGFGVPASNGCVSMFDEDAKAVFDWAPEGTRIKIHY